MRTARSLARSYAEHRFTALFAILLVAIAGHGLFGQVLLLDNPLEWLLGFGLVAVVLSVPSGRLRPLLAGLVSVSVVTRLTHGLLDHPGSLLMSQLLAAVACVVAAGVALHRSFAAGPVDMERIAAALDAYLLAGIAIGVGYWLMESALPGSFSSASTQPFTPARAIYFSFVTQATLGFGDVVPMDEHSQGVVIAQGVGGQIYLAVLVARLVSLYSAEEKT